MDAPTRNFFRQQQESDEENARCCDYGTANPQWASVSHGTYVSLEASGVHRSLGVHISFVRSTTMDSWKPIQLKMMELGGNRKLKAFFAQHSIPEDMSIVDKYNTRAAEWYRKNLRAMAEGTEPPPPLPPGTGHLKLNERENSTASAFKASSSGGMSVAGGGAIISDARNGYHGNTGDYGRSGYHGSGLRSYQSGGGYHDTAGYQGNSLGSSSGSMQGRPNQKRTDLPTNAELTDGLFNLDGLLGQEASAHVTGGVVAALGVAKVLGGRVKDLTKEQLQKAKDDGLVDNAVGMAKLGVAMAVDTTHWAVEKGTEVGRQTYSVAQEKGLTNEFVDGALDTTRTVLGTTAMITKGVAVSAFDMFADQFGDLDFGSSSPSGSPQSKGDRAASTLQGMSSGTMQGFGSDSAPSQAPVAQAPAPAPAAPKVDLWADDDWGDFK